MLIYMHAIWMTVVLTSVNIRSQVDVHPTLPAVYYIGGQPLPIIKVPPLMLLWLCSYSFHSPWTCRAPLFILLLQLHRQLTKSFGRNLETKLNDRENTKHRQIWHFFSLLCKHTGEWFNRQVAQSNKLFRGIELILLVWWRISWIRNGSLSPLTRVGAKRISLLIQFWWFCFLFLAVS